MNFKSLRTSNLNQYLHFRNKEREGAEAERLVKRCAQLPGFVGLLECPCCRAWDLLKQLLWEEVSGDRKPELGLVLHVARLQFQMSKGSLSFTLFHSINRKRLLVSEERHFDFHFGTMCLEDNCYIRFTNISEEGVLCGHLYKHWELSAIPPRSLTLTVKHWLYVTQHTATTTECSSSISKMACKWLSIMRKFLCGSCIDYFSKYNTYTLHSLVLHKLQINSQFSVRIHCIYFLTKSPLKRNHRWKLTTKRPTHVPYFLSYTLEICD